MTIYREQGENDWKEYNKEMSIDPKGNFIFSNINF